MKKLLILSLVILFSTGVYAETWSGSFVRSKDAQIATNVSGTKLFFIDANSRVSYFVKSGSTWGNTPGVFNSSAPLVKSGAKALATLEIYYNNIAYDVVYYVASNDKLVCVAPQGKSILNYYSYRYLNDSSSTVNLQAETIFYPSDYNNVLYYYRNNQANPYMQITYSAPLEAKMINSSINLPSYYVSNYSGFVAYSSTIYEAVKYRYEAPGEKPFLAKVNQYGVEELKSYNTEEKIYMKGSLIYTGNRFYICLSNDKIYEYLSELRDEPALVYTGISGCSGYLYRGNTTYDFLYITLGDSDRVIYAIKSGSGYLLKYIMAYTGYSYDSVYVNRRARLVSGYEYGYITVKTY